MYGYYWPSNSGCRYYVYWSTSLFPSGTGVAIFILSHPLRVLLVPRGKTFLAQGVILQVITPFTSKRSGHARLGHYKAYRVHKIFYQIHLCSHALKHVAANQTYVGFVESVVLVKIGPANENMMSFVFSLATWVTDAIAIFDSYSAPLGSSFIWRCLYSQLCYGIFLRIYASKMVTKESRADSFTIRVL